MGRGEAIGQGQRAGDPRILYSSVVPSAHWTAPACVLQGLSSSMEPISGGARVDVISMVRSDDVVTTARQALQEIAGLSINVIVLIIFEPQLVSAAP